MDDPRNANVHFLDCDEMRDRYEQAYKARLKAEQRIPIVRGVWLALYRRYDGKRVRLVGAGAGLDHELVAVAPLTQADADEDPGEEQALPSSLTITQAKRLLGKPGALQSPSRGRNPQRFLRDFSGLF